MNPHRYMKGSIPCGRNAIGAAIRWFLIWEHLFLTAILLVAHPKKYGVWNNTSDAGMKAARLWDKDWEKKPAGEVYLELNQNYHELCDILNVDLWTLDALWWVLKRKNK